MSVCVCGDETDVWDYRWLFKVGVEECRRNMNDDDVDDDGYIKGTKEDDSLVVFVSMEVLFMN